jgi:2-polyprenyl-3-methyl-5-hydroxy-6-metoxy-1,4-benzoquinol methylase
MCFLLEFEINRPRSSGKLYNYLISYKFHNAISKIPFAIDGVSVLDICCGSGMISEYYANYGAKVTGIDLSEEAISRAKTRKERYNFEADFKVADAYKLPFSDNSFDIVSVHDGLHHLKEPWKAVSEMVRVSKRGVIIIEPAKSFITMFSVLLGISSNYEGEDFVYRFKEKELQEWLKKAGCKKIEMKRYIMYYPHQPGKLFRIFDIQPLFFLVKVVFYLINIFWGRFGNKIQIIGLK